MRLGKEVGEFMPKDVEKKLGIDVEKRGWERGRGIYAK